MGVGAEADETELFSLPRSHHHFAKPFLRIEANLPPFFFFFKKKKERERRKKNCGILIFIPRNTPSKTAKPVGMKCWDERSRESGASERVTEETREKADCPPGNAWCDYSRDLQIPPGAEDVRC